jgi:predicted AAA+ superfamily ATPase
MKRYLEKHIREDLASKIVMLTGPRQTGKTTLSKMVTPDYDYFNLDNPEHRLNLIERSWDRSKELVIFDELHKMAKWKSWLKGVWDTEERPPSILVTGSAKLDTYKKVGDSLAGRFFQYRLHPLDLKEIHQILQPESMQEVLEQLMELGGFPEPFLKGSKTFYNKWKRSHLDIIIRQDLIDLENVREISSVETLIQLLRKRVGSPLSYSSIARDLNCSDKTVKKWMIMLENMYVIFRVAPYHRNIGRSLLKAPKIYFYDTGQVLGDSGVKFENLVACAVLKEVQHLQDCFGQDMRLYYLRTKDGREVDFLITKDGNPLILLEVKLSDDSPSSALQIFSSNFPSVKKIQIVKELHREKTFPDGLEIRQAHKWLSSFTF